MSAVLTGTGKALFQRETEAWWSGSWGAILTKGIFAIVFGVLAVAWPGMTLGVLIVIFGVFCLLDGLYTLIQSTTNRKTHKHWKRSLAAGVFGTILGALVLTAPFITGLVVLYFIAAWAVVMGTMSIINAVRLRKQVAMGWPLSSGIIALGFGISLFIIPFGTALAATWAIGFLLVIWGISLCYHSYHVRQESKGARAESQKQPETGKGS